MTYMRSVFLLLALLNGIRLIGQDENFTAEEKPWLWWYWMGSAVSEKGLAEHISAFSEAGIGGANVAAVYGVKGYEEKAIPFMSAKWREAIRYTGKLSDAYKMKLDVSLASAWPYGGPGVTYETSARHASGGKLFHAVGKQKAVRHIFDPHISRLEALSAYSDGGAYLNLSGKVSADGNLDYVFPDGNWEVYALFSAPTGQQVKRSGIGGEGLVMDHFSREAVEKYLHSFDSLLAGKSFIRSVFNDSYEVYGADYTNTFAEEFLKRRKYDFRERLDLFFSKYGTPGREALLCDYRETISDLLLDNFVKPWTSWANSYGIKTVEQAHGSPSSWLDLYAAADIPQTESFGSSNFHIPLVRTDKDYPEEVFGRPDKLLMKFASSAANTSGKRLASSETATWLGNHFRVSLSQVKPQVDEAFLSGINHIMLTCASYSPSELPFPGWLFYPASNFGPNGALFSYLPQFSNYVARCQRELQQTVSDNEVLLYTPVYDVWSECNNDDRTTLSMLAIHNPYEWFYKNDFGSIARKLRDQGFDFDYISDRQLQKGSTDGMSIALASGKRYKAIVIPSCRRMPLETLEAIASIARKGIPVIFANRAPADVPGLYEADKRRRQLAVLMDQLRKLPNVHISDQYAEALYNAGCRQEMFGELGLDCLRKRSDSAIVYFVANQRDLFKEGWVKLPFNFSSAVCYNPLTGKSGLMKRNGQEIFLQLLPGESRFIKIYELEKSVAPWPYFIESRSMTLQGPWNIVFEKGAPSIPASWISPVVQSWTNNPDTMSRYFSGMASYTTLFDAPADMRNKNSYTIDLGDVREMAEVFINDHFLGRVWCVPFRLEFPPSLLKAKGNKLTVKATNLDANRIIWLDKNNTPWQQYFFTDITYGKFNAAHWRPLESGIIGPVSIKCSVN